MSSIFKRSGRYYIQFYHKDRTPSRKRLSLRTTRKRPAQVKQRELEDAYVEGRFDPWTDDPFSYNKPDLEPLTFDEALGRFLDAKEQKGCTENTVRTYLKILRLLGKRVGDQRLDTMAPSDITAFVHRDDLAESTRHKRYTHLRTFLRWCRDKDYMTAEPLEQVAQPRATRKLPRAITPSELSALCGAIREDYNNKRNGGHIPSGLLIWRVPMFWFALYTGLRGRELGRLRWKDVSLDRSRIRVREPKSRREETVPLTSEAHRTLEDVPRRASEDFVFQAPSFEGRERSLKNFRNRASNAFRRARKQAGLREEITLHSLRHGFCTMLAEAGKSAVIIKKAARHADMATSMKYIHMANEHLKSELDDVFG